MDTEVKKAELCPFCGRADKLRRSVIDKDWVCYNCGKSSDTPGRPGKKDKGQPQVTESQPSVVDREAEIDNIDRKTETPSEAVPALAKDHRSRALNHRLRDEWDDAIEEYTKAIELDDNWVLAHYERGELFKRQGKKPDAIADFEKVISLSRDRETLKPANRLIEELKK